MTTADKGKSPADALKRVMENPAISMEDLAALMGVHKSTLTRRAATEGELPVPVARIGQRWIVPSAPVRAFLHLNDEKVPAA